MKRLLLMLLPLAVLCCGKGEEQQTGDALGVPRSVALHDAAETSLVFQWKKVEGAKGYNWELNEKEL